MTRIQGVFQLQSAAFDFLQLSLSLAFYYSTALFLVQSGSVRESPLVFQFIPPMICCFQDSSAKNNALQLHFARLLMRGVFVKLMSVRSLPAKSHGKCLMYKSPLSFGLGWAAACLVREISTSQELVVPWVELGT